MKAVLLFTCALGLIVVVCGMLLAIPFSSGDDRKAIAASAGVAVVVQMFTFAIGRVASQRSFFAAWIAGAALRLVTLIAYALIAVRTLAMPAPAALISLVTFLFVSTLVEPKFLTL